MLGLLLCSWCYTCCTDPGTPTEAWQRQMASAAFSGASVPVCRRSGLYKPPRAHYDSVTCRLTLNMDHFCPWVLNTVGFYNRKFFILFLLYTCITIFLSAIAIASLFPSIIAWTNSDSVQNKWFPGPTNIIVCVAALVIDVLLLFLLLPFFGMHLQMVSLPFIGPRYRPTHSLRLGTHPRSTSGPHPS